MSNTAKPAFTATRILLPIDFSPSSEAAIEAATGLAQQFHAGIHLVHIIPEFPDFNGSDFFPETSVLGERRHTIEAKLEARKQQMELRGIPTSFSIETGNDIVGNVMRVIQRENADMVVLSTHGLSGWRPLILGSIAEQVIKQVSCTLLLLQSSEPRAAAAEPAIQVWEDSFPQGAAAQPAAAVQPAASTQPAAAAQPAASTPHTASTQPAASTQPEPGASSQRRLDHIADDLAEQGGRTEQRYDQAHSIFTK